jgi:chromosome segregation ATPase
MSLRALARTFQRIEDLEMRLAKTSEHALQRATESKELTEIVATLTEQLGELRKSQTAQTSALNDLQKKHNESEKSFKERYTNILELLAKHTTNVEATLKEKSEPPPNAPNWTEHALKIASLELSDESLKEENKLFGERLTELEKLLNKYKESMEKQLKDVPSLKDLDTRLKMLATSLVGLDQKWQKEEADLKKYVEEQFQTLTKKLDELSKQ